MATTIYAAGDTIKIDQAFVSGKTRVSVNGQLGFEGKIDTEELPTFQIGSRVYTIESQKVGAVTGAVAFWLNIYEDGNHIHTGIHDQNGRKVRSAKHAQAAGAAQACGVIGGIVGVAIILALNASTGVVPGGAIGGAIGGGLGGAIGYGIGKALFG